MIAWVNFCKINNLIGIFIFDRIAADCKIVDNPPKLITKVAAKRHGIPFNESAILPQPLVISISPSKMQEICEGKRLRSGARDVITTKNIAIITPTESMLKEESTTISERVFCAA